MSVTLSLDAGLSGKVRLGVFVLDGVKVRDRDPALDAEVDGHCAELRTRHAGATSGEVPGIEDARGLYKSLGIDPTKTRPSNEALLRRVRKGDTLPRINSIVDVCNWCSLELQLPYGLYDLAHVSGPVELRLGHDGESYAGIRRTTSMWADGSRWQMTPAPSVIPRPTPRARW
jgi:DNA/RNA-binding domain of Phe-tRNA-synthetase-like protein